MTDEQRSAEFTKMEWLGAGSHLLPRSNSTIVLTKGYEAVIGADARHMAELVGDRPDESIEAHAFTEDFNQEVVFEYYDVGYVTIDDWADVDADALLDGVRKNTEDDNVRRKELGFAPLHVVGWLNKPTLDRASNTVYWAFEAKDESTPDGQLVNSVALRLGRHGYEKLVLITDRAHFAPTGNMLDAMMQAHVFNTGFRYSDYVKGDKLAGYGIAALVGAVVGAKFLKVGALAVGLLFLKKIGVFVLVGLGAAATWLKRLFSRRASS